MPFPARRRLVACSLAPAVLLLAPATSAAAPAARFAPALLRAHLMQRRAPATLSRLRAQSAVVGSMNVATAEPPVPRPPTRSCTVPLFTGFTFSQYAAQGFGYAPPAGCPGPWAKVVFSGDFSISPGVQYDRTADAWLGNANVYFGSTYEPLASQTATWHVERDVTDLTALLRSPQPGEVEIFNIVSASLGLNGVIGGSSSLTFYEPDALHPAPPTADVVLPMSGGYGGELVAVTSPGTLARTFTFPRNTVSAKLQLFTQSQASDEFWYTCISNDVAPALDDCGNTAFREAEITIDGRPAGVAPVYPWIYTGGIDPFLWQPIPGTQTLNFKPYEVDLTPFASILADGAPHAIAVGVYDSNYTFSTTGTLLVTTDPKLARTTGALTVDTLTPPSPMVAEHFTTPATAPNGTETVSSARSFTIGGYVNTSHGRVTTTIQQSVAFSNAQQIVDTPTLDRQRIVQRSTVSSSTATFHDGRVDVAVAHVAYPLDVDIVTTVSATQAVQTTTIAQGYEKNALDPLRFPGTAFVTNESTTPTDALAYDPATFALIGNSDMESAQTYTEQGSFGSCYAKTVTAANNVVTSVRGIPGCR